MLRYVLAIVVIAGCGGEEAATVPPDTCSQERFGDTALVGTSYDFEGKRRWLARVRDIVGGGVDEWLELDLSFDVALPPGTYDLRDGVVTAGIIHWLVVTKYPNLIGSYAGVAGTITFDSTSDATIAGTGANLVFQREYDQRFNTCQLLMPSLTFSTMPTPASSR